MKLILQTAGLFLLPELVDIGRYGFFPDIGDLKESSPDETAFMHYREKQREKEEHDKTVRHRRVPLTGISSYLRYAALPNPLRYRSDSSSRYVRRKAERIYRVMQRGGIAV